LGDVCVELEQTMARQAEVISGLELHLGLNSRKPLLSDGLGKPRHRGAPM